MPEPPPSQRNWWERTLVKAARKLFGQRVIDNQYALFDWHCQRFFPFHEHLTAAEWDYLEACFQSAVLYPEMPHDSGYDEYSVFSYSHRVAGDQVNSSRLAYGSLEYPDEMLAAARPVLAERGIALDPYLLDAPESFFYGLGWDFAAGHCKVYFRILDLAKLPFASLHELMETTLPTEQRRQEGLISYTYVEGICHEEKVYIYPRPEVAAYEELFQGTKGRVLMATSRRGTLTQYDVSSPKAWRQRLNPAGQALVDAYAANGLPLDTIAMRDNEHFTLYFPGAFLPFSRTKALR